jgi:hypothetical protein
MPDMTVPHPRQPRFELGLIVSTPGALETCPIEYISQASSMDRYQRGAYPDQCTVFR